MSYKPSTLIDRIYKVRQHEVAMLQARGYTINDDVIASVQMSQEDFINTYKSNIAMLRHLCRDQDGFPVQVWYVPSIKSVSVEDWKELFTSIFNPVSGFVATHIILISLYKVGALALAQMTSNENLYIERFLFDDLSYSPIHHVLQPKFTRLTKDQRDEYMNNPDNVPVGKLRTMWTSDPVARYYDYKPGDLILIENNDVTAPYSKEVVYYRFVVPQ